MSPELKHCGTFAGWQNVPAFLYCVCCGSENLLYCETYANGEEWQCQECGELIFWKGGEFD